MVALIGMVEMKIQMTLLENETRTETVWTENENEFDFGAEAEVVASGVVAEDWIAAAVVSASDQPDQPDPIVYHTPAAAAVAARVLGSDVSPVEDRPA